MSTKVKDVHLNIEDRKRLNHASRTSNVSTNRDKAKLTISHQIANDDIFARIKSMCENDVIDDSIDIGPPAFAAHRAAFWPFVNHHGMGKKLGAIYSAVASSGLPNSVGSKLDLPTQLNIGEWERQLSGSSDDQELLSFLRFGFPLGYKSPQCHSACISGRQVY